MASLANKGSTLVSSKYRNNIATALSSIAAVPCQPPQYAEMAERKIT